jgi:POT family proton-dependent oligopeptide transporter
MEQLLDLRMKVMTDKKGRRVIIDPAVTATRVYSYFYMCVRPP